MTDITLCKLAELEDKPSLGFDLDVTDANKRLFVVRKDNRYFAYKNCCPHAGAPLNWQGDKFLNHDGDYIQCSLHGALFEIETGTCIAGPCPGTRLDAIALKIEDDTLVINEESVN